MGWRGAIAGLIVLLFAGWAAGPAAAAPPLWVVRSPGAEIYLFGTMHALTPDAHWRTPVYDAAYAKAATVWFEADLDGADPVTINHLMARYGVDPDRTLSQKLTPRQLARLRPILAKGRMPLSQVDHLRPWAAALMLSMQPMLARGAEMQTGADAAITRAAKAETKQVRVFETLEDQVRIFADLSERAEVGYLADVIAERARHGRKSRRPQPGLEAAWLAGDMSRLGPEVVGAMARDTPEFYDRLIRRRNLSWADVLTREMTSGGAELVNVGALHMLGPDGLPALMKARGFEVERLQ
jgi:uncharacterized protein YbaP (TraB family)